MHICIDVNILLSKMLFFNMAVNVMAIGNILKVKFIKTSKVKWQV